MPTMKRYFTRSIGAITVLLTTPATPPEIKLFNDLEPSFDCGSTAISNYYNLNYVRTILTLAEQENYNHNYR